MNYLDIQILLFNDFILPFTPNSQFHVFETKNILLFESIAC